MQTPLVLIAAMVAVPTIILLALRINAAIVFLSLCLGSVLVQFVGNDTSSFINLFSTDKLVMHYGASIFLLLLPAVFTMIVMIGTVRGSFRLALNVFPAIAVGAVGLLLAEQYFTPGLRGAISSTSAWHDIQKVGTLIVTASTVVSLLFLWLQRPKRSGRDESGKGGKHH
ncbi:MAG TPA: hypothetical protein VMB52_06980 [Verrucomicrobiae bacterium]|nr:hypothetical protein [Verrucomicrobiae bacterium]